MPDDLLPECAFPKCEYASRPGKVMCNGHDHVTIAAFGSWVEPAERSQS